MTGYKKIHVVDWADFYQCMECYALVIERAAHQDWHKRQGLPIDPPPHILQRLAERAAAREREGG